MVLFEWVGCVCYHCPTVLTRKNRWGRNIPGQKMTIQRWLLRLRVVAHWSAIDLKQVVLIAYCYFLLYIAISCYTSRQRKCHLCLSLLLCIGAWQRNYDNDWQWYHLCANKGALDEIMDKWEISRLCLLHSCPFCSLELDKGIMTPLGIQQQWQNYLHYKIHFY